MVRVMKQYSLLCVSLFYFTVSSSSIYAQSFGNSYTFTPKDHTTESNSSTIKGKTFIPTPDNPNSGSGESTTKPLPIQNGKSTNQILSPQTGLTSLEQNMDYYVLQQDIRSVLEDISSVIKIPIITASNVKGKATAGQYSGAAMQVITNITHDLNLHWYFDGSTIYVTRVSDAITHIIPLQGISVQELVYALQKATTSAKQFPFRYDDHNNIIVLYGPPKYVAFIEMLAQSLIHQKMRSKPNVLFG
jgi:type II secretory pathway component GspD/PulD (secretin)